MKETQLYLQDVHRSFDGFKAINGLSMAIAKRRAPGRGRARTGPARPRCSTSSPARRGPTQGRVVWDEDTDLTRLDEADTARLGIGRKFQKPTVFETLSVEANLMLALAGQARGRRRRSSTSCREPRRGGWTSCSIWSA